MRLTGKDLAIKDCDFVAEGKAPADIVKQFVEHLRSEHGIDMPDAEDILDREELEPVRVPGSRPDEQVQLVVTRLREELGLQTEPS